MSVVQHVCKTTPGWRDRTRSRTFRWPCGHEPGLGASPGRTLLNLQRPEHFARAAVSSGRPCGVLVSVVIPARDWDGLLDQTIRSVLAAHQKPGIDVEVIIGLAAEPPDGLPARVRAVTNPSGTIPDGLNAAVSASSGDRIVRVDARCNVQADHVMRVLKGLERDEVGCVGGAALVLDRGLFGSTYALAFNSPLLGPTVYRYRRKSGPVDAAYLGAWRRSELEALGGFDSRLIRNQDNELAERVRASGKQVWYDSDLVVGYYNDRTLIEALRHHHEFGLWRMIQREQGSRALTPRHVAALAGLASVGVAAAGAVAHPRTRRWALVAGVAAYAGAGALSWRTATRLRRARPDIEGPGFHPAAPLLAPALAALLNAGWLVGLVRGALRRR